MRLARRDRQVSSRDRAFATAPLETRSGAHAIEGMRPAVGVNVAIERLGRGLCGDHPGRAALTGDRDLGCERSGRSDLTRSCRNSCGRPVALTLSPYFEQTHDVVRGKGADCRARAHRTDDNADEIPRQEDNRSLSGNRCSLRLPGYCRYSVVFPAECGMSLPARPDEVATTVPHGRERSQASLFHGSLR